jgi:MFS family permease
VNVHGGDVDPAPDPSDRSAPSDPPPAPASGTVTVTVTVTEQARRARVAVGVLFFTNGALLSNVVPRFPEIQHDLGLSNTQFGLAVAASPFGALLAGLAAGALIRRWGSPLVAIVATLAGGAAFLLAGSAPTGLLLGLGMLLAGAADSLTDVAQNSHGLRVQNLYGRSVLNSFHAVWSIGAVAGAGTGALAAQLDVPLPVHLACSAIVFGAAAVVARRWLLPEGAGEVTPSAPAAPPAPSDAAARAPGTVPWGVLGALVVVAIGGAVVEDSGASWSAIYLAGTLGASAFAAGAGFMALQGMQFVGRMLGDRLVDRLGQRAVARAGGALVLVAMSTALLVPTVPGTVLGFGLAGLGVATLIPAAMHGADQLPGLRAGSGLTIVSWLLRVGFLVSPPLVGAIADASSLRAGLVVVPVAGLLVVLASRVLAGRTGPATP